MKNKIRSISAILTTQCIVLPLVAFAQLSRPTNSYGLAQGDFATLIMVVVKWFLGFVGILAVLMIVVSGIMYITSGGDSGRTETAKGYLLYSVTGLVIALLAYAIVVIIGRALGA